MIGKEFKVPEENVKDLMGLQESINKHRFAMDYHAGQATEGQRDPWASIKELVSELDFERWNYSYDSKVGIVRCVSRNWRHEGEGR